MTISMYARDGRTPVVEAATPSLRRRMLYSGVYIFGVLLLAELCFRAVFPLPEIQNFNRVMYSPLHVGVKSRSFLMNASFAWTSSLDGAGSVCSLNLYGFRDAQWTIKKRKGKRRIAFVGDSFVEGFMASDNETIPAAFAERAGSQGVGVEALNLGVGAADLWTYCTLVRDAMVVLQPDEVILVFYANDFAVTVFKPEWLRDAIVPQTRNWRAPRAYQVCKRLLDGRSVPRRWTSRPFPFLPAVPDPRNPWQNGRDSFPYVDEDIAAAMEAGEFNPFAMNELSGYERFLQKPVDVSPVLSELRDYVESHGGTLCVAYIPYSCQVSDYYVPFRRRFAERREIVSLKGKGYHRHERRLRRACARLGLRFLPLTRVLRAREDEGRRLYWAYDGHLRPAGYRLVGETLFDWWHRSRTVAPELRGGVSSTK